MGWDFRVYLAKKRISDEKLQETYLEMQRRFGAAVEDDDPGDDGDESEDADVFQFARFRLDLVRDGKAGLYLYVERDYVSHDGLEEVGACMSQWAELLGGEISEGDWSARQDEALNKRVQSFNLPKYGPADTVLYVAFDADGNERGKKSIAKDALGYVKPKMLEPAWLVENAIVRIEYVSYSSDGTVFDHVTHKVNGKGEMKALRRG